jgi:hypothetical protein
MYLFWKGQYDQSYSNVHGIMAGEFPAARMETSIPFLTFIDLLGFECGVSSRTIFKY